MAQVYLPIGGFNYAVSCRDGEEPHFLKLGESIAEKVEQAKASVGNPGEVRQLLFAALLFADENSELKSNPQIKSQAYPAATVPQDDGALLALVERIERLASLLENGGTNA
jgi:cell division protein ZapA